MEGNPVHPVAAAGSVADVVDPPPAAAPVPSKAASLTPPVVLPSGWQRGLTVAIASGALLTILGFVFARERACAGMLLASHYAIGIGLGGLMFLVLGYVTQAGWHTAFRRVPEAMAGTLPVGAALTGVALLGFTWLYEWSHADAVAGDALLQEKSFWLNTGFFLARAAIVLALWLVFARLMRRTSVEQDSTGDVRAVGRLSALSAVFLVIFAITFSVASFDWLMSLEPHWYSTVYAVYNFAGLFVSALAAMLILLIVLRRMGPLKGILRDDHLHDVARLTFGFATFWGYIWFCQYMLIWYGNIPEETAYYVTRSNGAWKVLMLVNPIVNWLIPFLVLLPRPAKRSESILIKVATLLLLGRWLDLYLMINPSIAPGGPALGIWDLAPLLVALPLVVLWCYRVLGRRNLLPVGDPSLGESLHHHT